MRSVRVARCSCPWRLERFRGPNGVPAARRHFNVHSRLRTRAHERFGKLSIPRRAANLSVMTTLTRCVSVFSYASPALLCVVLGGCAGVSESNVHTAGKAAAPADKGQASAGRALTLDELYDPSKRVDFSGHPRTSVTWIDGSHWIERKPGDAKSKDAKSRE